ncbi:MAG: RluA family pseudouridine synthase [Planctomycetota bacterium]
MNELEHEVSAAEAGRSALSVLSDLLPDVPTWALKQLFTQELVLRDARPCGAGQGLAAGEVLAAEWDDLPRIEPRRLEGFEVLWRGAEVWACHKPAGVSSEPERDGTEPLLRGAVLWELRRGGAPLTRPRVVHRLDKETTGAILIALSHAALAALTAQLEAREVHKGYVALVEGIPREDEGVIEAPLVTGKRKVRADDPAGVSARTRWRVLERFARHAWVRAEPETGRTHQVRVHLAHLGHPIVGDALYGTGGPLLLSRLKPGYVSRGEEKPLLARVALHAHDLRFRDPASGAPVEVTAPLPHDLTVALKQLRRLQRR